MEKDRPTPPEPIEDQAGTPELPPNSEEIYVHLRRYFVHLEQSLKEGIKWVVFEPDNQATWNKVRDTISNFLTREWQSGALKGTSRQQAYFVHCDQTTMTQNDLDNGRLVCVVGIAPVKPAEFVIFRIGQWTADCKDCK